MRPDQNDLDEEIRGHLAISIKERIDRGEDPQEARLAALKEFGNVTLTVDAARRVWTPWWLDALHDYFSDIRYAVRALVKKPAFSLTVIGVITLGIGLNATVFTMLKGMALNPLGGVDGASRLTVLYGETSTGRQVRVSYPDYQYLRDHDSAFADLFGSSFLVANLGKGRHARQIAGELVTGNYFQVLGVRARLGRTLLPSDEVAPGKHPVIVLSDGLWRREFGADPDIVGKSVEVNSYLLTVVGVADAAFHGTIVSYDVEAFIPVMMATQIGVYGGLPPAAAATMFSNRRAAVVFPHGYLRPGTTLASATAQTGAIWASLSRDRPLTDPAQRMKVVPFRASPTGGQAYLLPTLVLLTAMGLLVLLIACANIAGLVLVRGVSRRGELAVRLALGATRTRIVRLLLIENFILVVPGALLGVVLAQQAIPMFVSYAELLAAPQRLFFNIGVDRLVIGFSALVASGCAFAFGFVPALQNSRIDLVSSINQDASPRGATRGRLRSGLVIAQVAVSLLLLVGAGLVMRSLDAQRRANPGFESDHVSAVVMDLKQNAYDEAHGRVFYRHLLEAARADAGVESATLAEFMPLAFLDTRPQRVAIEGYQPLKGEDPAMLTNTVGSDYFKTLRIPLVAGRAFEERDDETAAPVAVVNNTFAQKFWGGANNALGKRIRAGEGGDWRTVVGVASDVKYLQITEAPRPYYYVPSLQVYRSRMVLHTRGGAPVDRLVDEARARVLAIDAEQPLLSAKPLAFETRGALLFMELTAMMLFLFGSAGIALAAMGTYGLVSYTVKQSTHEIGIRMALGAPGLSVVREFAGRGLKLGAIGAAIGIVAALGVSRLLGSMLYGVSATDLVSFTRAFALVLGCVGIATIIPAWQASRTNVLSALRHQ